tara:strand:- start:5460 stop:5981 length:522 start_codon:yes stop_codon:yes gene_type:complete
MMMAKLRSASAEGKKGLTAMINSGEKGKQAAERMGFTAKKGGMVMKAKGGTVMKAKGGTVMAKGGGMMAKGGTKGGAVMARGGGMMAKGMAKGGMMAKGYNIGGAIEEIKKKKMAKGGAVMAKGGSVKMQNGGMIVAKGGTKGGVVKTKIAKSSASKRADGIIRQGKTVGRMV